jgi:hypothetical protein
MRRAIALNVKISNRATKPSAVARLLPVVPPQASQISTLLLIACLTAEVSPNVKDEPRPSLARLVQQ